jgi:hypothetical protein
MLNTAQPVTLENSSDATTIQESIIKNRRRSIIQEFLLNTSAHALPGIARSKSIQNRVFWSISFIAFTAITIFFVIKEIMNYFEYPTTFDRNFIEERTADFPAFTLCHASGLRLDRLLEPYLNYTKSLNLNISNDTKVWSSKDAGYVSDFLAAKFKRNESISDYYFSLSSIMQSCSFNFERCSAADFISFIAPSIGVCYTFNAKLKNSTINSVRCANQYGGDGRLDINLYIHHHQDIPFYTEG